MTKFKFTPAQLEQLNKAQLHVHGYTLINTCQACPEQYNVFDSAGNQVAYLRLRHGGFRVDVPDCGGETIFTASPKGDGSFCPDERYYYLKTAVEKISEYYANSSWVDDSWSDPGWINEYLKKQ